LARLLWLPALLWVAWMERRVLARGEPLDPQWLDAARAVGVRDPARVRVQRVGQLPVRLPSGLRRALERTGLLPPVLAGMALRYGILLREDCRDDPELLLHELAHTAQYERLGGIGPFLRRYLVECCSAGYGASALEAEATALAKQSARSLMVEAVQRHTAYEEQMQNLAAEALAADEDIERTGEVYRAEDVHAWMTKLATTGSRTRPKPWRR